LLGYVGALARCPVVFTAVSLWGRKGSDSRSHLCVMTEKPEGEASRSNCAWCRGCLPALSDWRQRAWLTECRRWQTYRIEKAGTRSIAGWCKRGFLTDDRVRANIQNVPYGATSCTASISEFWQTSIRHAWRVRDPQSHRKRRHLSRRAHKAR
jgi:hypothetical protein